MFTMDIFLIINIVLLNNYLKLFISIWYFRDEEKVWLRRLFQNDLWCTVLSPSLHKNSPTNFNN